MQVFFKAWDKLPNKDEPEESAEDLWNSPALVYLTLRKYLKISDKEDIVIGIALGYEEPCQMNDHRSKKLTFEEACHFFN